MKKNIVFVDCFNTIILRKASANDVLFEWATNLGEEFAIEPAIIYNLFQDTRRKMAISNFVKSFESEMYFEEVVKNFAVVLKSNIFEFNTTKFIDRAVALYSETEMKNHYLNISVVKRLFEYKNQGKKIYLVSDFYCSKQTLFMWLENLGVLELFDDIFVSCDYNKSKSSGRLYNYVLKRLNIEASQVVMLGDNRFSDNFRAGLAGIESEHIVSKIEKDNQNLLDKTKYGVFENFYSLWFNNNENDLNFSNHAFPLFLFTKRLYEEVEKSGTKDVFFLAREGQFLKRLFDKYVEIIKEKYRTTNTINTHYLYASRNSVLCASLDEIDKEDFYYLFRSSKSMSVEKFLLTLNFSQNQINEISKSFAFEMDKRVNDFAKSKQFKALKNNKLFVELYNKKRIEQRTAFELYMNQFGVDFEKEGIALVDIGWKGTMQDLFNKFFDGKVALKGYYVGSKKRGVLGNEKVGLLYDKNNNNLFGNAINKHCVYNYEQICRANHNRCDGYAIIDGVVKPVFDTKLKDEKIYNDIIKPLQDQIVLKFEQIAKYDYKNLSLLPIVAVKIYYELNKNKTKADWEWLAKSQDTHHDNFGDVRYPFKIATRNVRELGFKIADKFFICTKYLTIKNLKLDLKARYPKNQKKKYGMRKVKNFQITNYE